MRLPVNQLLFFVGALVKGSFNFGSSTGAVQRVKSAPKIDSLNTFLRFSLTSVILLPS